MGGEAYGGVRFLSRQRRGVAAGAAAGAAKNQGRRRGTAAVLGAAGAGSGGGAASVRSGADAAVPDAAAAAGRMAGAAARLSGGVLRPVAQEQPDAVQSGTAAGRTSHCPRRGTAGRRSPCCCWRGHICCWGGCKALQSVRKGKPRSFGGVFLFEREKAQEVEWSFDVRRCGRCAAPCDPHSPSPGSWPWRQPR